MRKKIYFLIALIVLGGIVYFSLDREAKAGQEILDQENAAENDEEPENTEEEDKIIAIKYAKEGAEGRASAQADGEIVFQLEENEEIEVLSSMGGWDKIKYKGEIAYLKTDDLSLERIERKPVEEKKTDLRPKEEVEIRELTIINGILLVNKEYGLPKNHFKAVNPEAQSHLDQMVATIKEEEGLSLLVHSAHRTNELQRIFYNNSIERNGYEIASIYSAKPGHSEHESGLAFDICDRAEKHRLKESFAGSPEGIWLKENAHRFGFILRYPKGKTNITGYAYEPWHFRYVGIEHAEIIYDRDITLEEYLLPEEY